MCFHPLSLFSLLTALSPDLLRSVSCSLQPASEDARKFNFFWCALLLQFLCLVVLLDVRHKRYNKSPAVPSIEHRRVQKTSSKDRAAVYCVCVINIGICTLFVIFILYLHFIIPISIKHSSIYCLYYIIYLCYIMVYHIIIKIILTNTKDNNRIYQS